MRVSFYVQSMMRLSLSVVHFNASQQAHFLSSIECKSSSVIQPHLEPHVPELLDLAPDEAGHPGEDAVLHGRGEGASLGGVGGQVPAHDILDPLRGQDEQN